jgi:organic hydroperoxide reductase OsmC/OhrA
MSRHDAEIAWTSDGAFLTGHYSRAHEWRFDGGQVVRGSSSPHVVREPMSDPFGVDPEEALVASVASCHMLWFLDLARKAGLDVASYRDAAEGTMGPVEEGRYALTRITLRPSIAFAGRQPDAGELSALHDRAHALCFIANSLKADIFVEANDTLVDKDGGAAPPALA